MLTRIDEAQEANVTVAEGREEITRLAALHRVGLFEMFDETKDSVEDVDSNRARRERRQSPLRGPPGLRRDRGVLEDRRTRFLCSSGPIRRRTSGGDPNLCPHRNLAERDSDLRSM